MRTVRRAAGGHCCGGHADHIALVFRTPGVSELGLGLPMHPNSRRTLLQDQAGAREVLGEVQEKGRWSSVSGWERTCVHQDTPGQLATTAGRMAIGGRTELCQPVQGPADML